MDKEIDLDIVTEVIEAKEPKTTKWKVETFAGFEVMLVEADGLTVQEIHDSRYWSEGTHRVAAARNDLKVGDKVLIKDIFDYWWRLMEVTELTGDEGDVMCESGLWGWIEYGKDERNCWVCKGLCAIPVE